MAQPTSDRDVSESTPSITPVDMVAPLAEDAAVAHNPIADPGPVPEQQATDDCVSDEIAQSITVGEGLSSIEITTRGGLSAPVIDVVETSQSSPTAEKL